MPSFIFKNGCEMTFILYGYKRNKLKFLNVILFVAIGL